MKTILFSISITFLLLFLIFSSCKSKFQHIVIGDFEKGEILEEIGWTWWSLHGDNAGRVEFSNEARDGSRCIRIVHEGAMHGYSDWALTNETRLDVNPGEEWTVSAWVKYENTDRFGIEIMGLANGELITELFEIHRRTSQIPPRGLWPSGYAVAYGTGDWELLEASAIIPSEIDQVYVRISGLGRTLAWVDDLQIRKGLTKRTAKPKPKVEGWAFNTERVKDQLGRGIVVYPLDSNRMYILYIRTGEEKALADWPSRDGLGRYNHNARHQMGVAYLDGYTPFLILARGTYTVIKLEAYQYYIGRV